VDRYRRGFAESTIGRSCEHGVSAKMRRGGRKYGEQRGVTRGQLSRKGRRDECAKKDLLLERAVGMGKKGQGLLSVPQ
jgi:hypothetical protein